MCNNWRCNHNAPTARKDVAMQSAGKPYGCNVVFPTLSAPVQAYSLELQFH
jgi:hypothetical protein